MEKDQFRGCLVGGLLGECLCVPLKAYHGIVHKVAQLFVDTRDYRSYREKTVLTNALGNALLNDGGYDAVSAARACVEAYYSAHPVIRSAFGKLKDIIHHWKWSNYNTFDTLPKNIVPKTFLKGYGPAAWISAYPLYFRHQTELMIRNVRSVAELTHPAMEAYGACELQAYAIAVALQYPYFTPEQFLDMLITLCDSGINLQLYQPKLVHLKTLLSEETSVVVKALGNDSAGLEAVPMAIYCVLKGTSLAPENAFEATMALTIRVGGCTDGIATLAGAIAGAWHGLKSIPQAWLQLCDGYKNSIMLADKLAEHASNTLTNREIYDFGNYDTLESRLESFKGWPHLKPSPMELAGDGFFHFGTQDCVQCYYCNCKLRDFEPLSDPRWDHLCKKHNCPASNGPDNLYFHL
ncbi:ADP-ribosylhydrolase ARH3-like [Paramacrobiotus metropolitanus]|uniref:ADP-ribosylhydrolase ARH3-like n=1 Tax=Paramacrobiotus metropolitanus TaxID=2943436 RepID=UPI002445C935|nr:ADP-ribosylhydrolase ARH3-like [Paramacrobiotus metropolitanus]